MPAKSKMNTQKDQDKIILSKDQYERMINEIEDLEDIVSILKGYLGIDEIYWEEVEPLGDCPRQKLVIQAEDKVLEDLSKRSAEQWKDSVPLEQVIKELGIDVDLPDQKLS